jgi:hypothetical protein
MEWWKYSKSCKISTIKIEFQVTAVGVLSQNMSFYFSNTYFVTTCIIYMFIHSHFWHLKDYFDFVFTPWLLSVRYRTETFQGLGPDGWSLTYVTWSPWRLHYTLWQLNTSDTHYKMPYLNWKTSFIITSRRELTDSRQPEDVAISCASSSDRGINEVGIG